MAVICNEAYMQGDDSIRYNIIKSNQALLDAIKEQNNLFSAVYSFVGSNRQSQEMDKSNSKNSVAVGYFSGSCFRPIQIASDYVGATLDTFLLADLHNDLADGTSFARAINPTYDGTHSDWIVDESKISILYAQIQKIATAHPDEPIQFDFIDDMGDIHKGLLSFFESNKDWVPKNVTLNLIQYDGADPQRPFLRTGETNFSSLEHDVYDPEYRASGALVIRRGQIIGEGIREHDYRTGVKNLQALALETAPVLKQGEIRHLDIAKACAHYLAHKKVIIAQRAIVDPGAEKKRLEELREELQQAANLSARHAEEAVKSAREKAADPAIVAAIAERVGIAMAEAALQAKLAAVTAEAGAAEAVQVERKRLAVEQLQKRGIENFESILATSMGLFLFFCLTLLFLSLHIPPLLLAMPIIVPTLFAALTVVLFSTFIVCFNICSDVENHKEQMPLSVLVDEYKKDTSTLDTDRLPIPVSVAMDGSRTTQKPTLQKGGRFFVPTDDRKQEQLDDAAVAHPSSSHSPTP